MRDFYSDLRLFFISWLGLCIVATFVFRRRSARLNAKPLERAIGRILSARLEPYFSGNADDWAPAFKLIVEYEYVANGLRHVGKRIKVNSGIFNERKQAEAALKRYPAGGRVEVFYAPEKPEFAVLEGGRGHGHVMGYLFWYLAIFFATCGASILIAGVAPKG